MLKLRWIPTGKKQLLPLLLLGDEQESMIDRYLGRSTLYAAEQEGQTVGVMAFVRLSEQLYELKNLAVAPEWQGQGIGKWMVGELCRMCRERGAQALRAGTGESPKTMGFYRACGFVPCGREPDFFLRNYDHPIVEDGVTLRDMIYLEKKL